MKKRLATLESSRIKLQQIELETKHFESKSVEAKNNTEQLTQQAENLNKNIADLKTQLQKLTNDRNLISDEYGPYVEEGKSQSKDLLRLNSTPITSDNLFNLSSLRWRWKFTHSRIQISN
ncbi:hypothetical protein [Pseudomonas sp. S11A4]|uniref:hypothetical protein n=1 Tax=Pseudomonas sp. S11A4 TaxID=1476791 RepID=UPI00215CF7CF|nr:hypothetical protein [Pseudomonas sp. S11A4]MCR8935654.1 hypothetical protein [Pseudomonas sp. S11A4]